MLPCRGARRHLGLSGVHFRSQRRERNSAACTPQQARPARGVAPRRSTSTRLAGPALRASSGRQSSQRSKGRGPRRWWPTRLVQPMHTSRRCRSCSVAAHQVSEKLQPAPWRRNSSWPVSECAGWNRGPQARGVAPPERCQVGSATASQALRGELVQTPPPERDGAAAPASVTRPLSPPGLQPRRAVSPVRAGRPRATAGCWGAARARGRQAACSQGALAARAATVASKAHSFRMIMLMRSQHSGFGPLNWG